MPTENKLPGAINEVERSAVYCVERAEFFKAKSQAKYAPQAAKNWQEGAEAHATAAELLRELAQYRNFTQATPFAELRANVAADMRAQGYDY